MNALDDQNTSNLNGIDYSLRSLSLTASSLNITGVSDNDYVPTAEQRSTLIPTLPRPVPNSVSELDFSGISEIIDRGDISGELAAMLINAVFEMVGWITSEEKGLIVTASCIQRKLVEAREKTWRTDLERRFDDVEKIECFSFDGKRNENAIIIENPHGKSKTLRSSRLMENVAIMRHPDLEPLGFISTLDGTSSFIFEHLWEFLNPGGLKEFSSLVAIGADGTHVNTGSNNGIIRKFETKIGRNLHRII